MNTTDPRDKAKGSYDIQCPKCKRTYFHDYCLGKLVETIRSERKPRSFCSYCQKREPK